jgi:hypothetical protein
MNQKVKVFVTAITAVAMLRGVSVSSKLSMPSATARMTAFVIKISIIKATKEKI